MATNKADEIYNEYYICPGPDRVGGFGGLKNFKGKKVNISICLSSADCTCKRYREQVAKWEAAADDEPQAPQEIHCYKVELTKLGKQHYEALYKQMTVNNAAQVYDFVMDIEELSPLGLVLGELGTAIYVHEPTLQALIEALKVEMELEFNAGNEFTGEHLKPEWFKFVPTTL